MAYLVVGCRASASAKAQQGLGGGHGLPAPVVSPLLRRPDRKRIAIDFGRPMRTLVGLHRRQENPSAHRHAAK